MSSVEEGPSEEGPLLEGHCSNSIIDCEIVDSVVDSANYSHSYYLYHQNKMLCDQVRMKAYYKAIFDNRDDHFQGKTVLDVGTGTGILAIWAAKAGARKVYAVETNAMEYHSQTLINANDLQDVIKVIHGSIEDIILPETVDVIISAWMGDFLLGKSMFDSVIYARDHWLKSTGVMYPSHARMLFAPIRSNICKEKNDEYREAMNDWKRFTDESINSYDVDMSVLTGPFQDDCYRYFLQKSTWCKLSRDQVIGKAVVIKKIDCSTVTIADIKEFTSVFSSTISKEDTQLCGFAGWFKVHFRGTNENPAALEIKLKTAPSVRKCTHWGQEIFVLDHPPVDVRMGDVLNLTLTMERSHYSDRSLKFRLVGGIVDKNIKLEKTFYLE